MSASSSSLETDSMDIEPEAKSTIQVNIRTLTGKNDVLEVSLSNTVEEVQLMYEDRTGMPLFIQRYVYQSKMLERPRTLESYGFENGAIITLVTSMRGDIGTWAPHPSSPLVELLKGGASFADARAEEVADMVALIKKENARDGESNKEIRSAVSSSEPVLSAAQCQGLARFIEERLAQAQSATQPAAGRVIQTGVDSQILLKLSELTELIGLSTIQHIQRLFAAPINEIKLRRVMPPPASEERLCINFHVDYSLKTMAIALNPRDEYTGGSIVYASDEGLLDSPSRPLGCALVHDNSWVHGVTSLTQGVRYSLFLLSTPSDE